MFLFSPYSGSLLRLALTTVAVIALFAAAFVLWEGYRGAKTGHRTEPQMTLPALGR